VTKMRPRGSASLVAAPWPLMVKLRWMSKHDSCFDHPLKSSCGGFNRRPEDILYGVGTRTGAVSIVSAGHAPSPTLAYVKP